MIRHFNLAAQWIALVVTIFVISCAKAPGNAARVQALSNSDEKVGIYKTPEELQAIVEQALKKVTDPDPRKNFAIRYVIARNYLVKQHNREIDKLGGAEGPEALARRHLVYSGGHLFPKKAKDPDALDVSIPFDWTESPIWSMAELKLTFRKDGLCEPKGRNSHQVLASIKDQPGKLCVSLQELAQHDETLRDTMAFFIHYAVELGGGSENEAQTWEDDFIEYHKGLVHESWVQGAKTAEGWIKLEKTAATLKSMVSDHVGDWSAVDQIINSQIGQFHSLRTTFLPLPFDPLRFELAYNPLRIDLFDYYSNAALAFIDQSSYILPGSKFYTSKSDALAKLSATIDLIKQVQINLKAVRTGDVEPVCLSPAYGDAQSIFQSEKYRPGKRLALSTGSPAIGLFNPMVVNMSDNRVMMFPPAVNCRGTR